MNSLRRFFSGILIVSGLGLGAAGCGPDSGRPGEAADLDLYPLLGPDTIAQGSGAAAKLVIPDGAIKLIADRYIVQLKDTAFKMGGPQVGRAMRAAIARDVVLRHGLPEQAVVHVYEVALNGFVASMSEAQALRLAGDPDVELIEQDQVMTVDVASWGLDRTDQRDLPLNDMYAPDCGNGAGVHAYIIDTGISSAHSELAGRVEDGFSVFGNNTNDCHGHGTHVAGTVGGTNVGVASGVTLHTVRVLNCRGSGFTSWIIAGVDWVTQNRVDPAVANMSLGGGASTALDNAVNNSVDSGVFYAVAAGNSNANACNYSPARAANATTVGATTNTDARASFSNYGTCVDIFAPGVNITSAWNDGGLRSISGTSMASPHVAGAAALYLGAHPTASPADVTTALSNASTTDKVGNAGPGSPNKLDYVGEGLCP